jgi:uncharacterized protein (DUF58 family)
METTAILKKVRKLEIKTKAIIKDLFAGDYHSAFKGRGMSFSEVREYSYGDDIRNIDWNVTARSTVPFVKVFEEERELTIMLLIDMSASNLFGTQTVLKKDLITEICAVLAFSALGNQDKVGAVFFTDRIEKYIPPKKGKQNVLKIIREMILFEPSGKKTDLNIALQFLNNIQKKKAVSFIISDFMSPSFENYLRLAGKKHDVIGLHIFDIREKELPDVGLIRIINPETGAIQVLDSTSSDVRLFYKNRFENHVDQLEKIFSRLSLDFISLSTSDSYILKLHSFFKRRSKR